MYSSPPKNYSFVIFYTICVGPNLYEFVSSMEHKIIFAQLYTPQKFIVTIKQKKKLKKKCETKV